MPVVRSWAGGGASERGERVERVERVERGYYFTVVRSLARVRTEAPAEGTSHKVIPLKRASVHPAVTGGSVQRVSIADGDGDGDGSGGGGGDGDGDGDSVGVGVGVSVGVGVGVSDECKGLRQRVL